MQLSDIFQKPVLSEAKTSVDIHCHALRIFRSSQDYYGVSWSRLAMMLGFSNQKHQHFFDVHHHDKIIEFLMLPAMRCIYHAQHHGLDYLGFASGELMSVDQSCIHLMTNTRLAPGVWVHDFSVALLQHNKQYAAVFANTTLGQILDDYYAKPVANSRYWQELCNLVNAEPSKTMIYIDAVHATQAQAYIHDHAIYQRTHAMPAFAAFPDASIVYLETSSQYLRIIKHTGKSNTIFAYLPQQDCMALAQAILQHVPDFAKRPVLQQAVSAGHTAMLEKSQLHILENQAHATRPDLGLLYDYYNESRSDHGGRHTWSRIVQVLKNWYNPTTDAINLVGRSNIASFHAMLHKLGLLVKHDHDIYPGSGVETWYFLLHGLVIKELHASPSCVQLAMGYSSPCIHDLPRKSQQQLLDKLWQQDAATLRAIQENNATVKNFRRTKSAMLEYYHKPSAASVAMLADLCNKFHITSSSHEFPAGQDLQAVRRYLENLGPVHVATAMIPDRVVYFYPQAVIILAWAGLRSWLSNHGLVMIINEIAPQDIMTASNALMAQDPAYATLHEREQAY